MLLLVLCVLALQRDNGVAASLSSHRIDNVIFKFIVDSMPILFPPSRILLHSCISYDDVIELSREMSNNRLTHGIRNSLEEFERMIYDGKDHRNLYVLDLDCDHATEILQQAHSREMFVAPAKWLLLQDRRTVMDNVSQISTYDDSVSEVFEDLAIYPDSDVVLAQRFDGNFMHLMSVYQPSSQRGIIWENRGNWTAENGLQMRTFDVASARRRNLQGIAFKSCLVMTNPDTINHLTDYVDRYEDIITKAFYPWVLHLANRMNVTITFNIESIWGYRSENGSWNGLSGMLQRREIDIGGTGMHVLGNRLEILEYIPLYTHTR